MVKSGQAWVVEFVTTNATGALADADVSPAPAGVLLINGVANGAAVTIAKISTGLYSASVTLPTLTAGAVVAIAVNATIGGVATGGIAKQDTADTVRVSDVDAVLTAIKGAGWSSETLVALKTAVDALTPSGGSGANTVAVTVTGGGSPLEGASVRLIKAGISYVLATNASGVATFALDDGTYALAVSLSGWAFTPTTVVVDGSEAVSAAMTQVVIPAPTEPDTCVVYVYARDQHGAPASGVGVQWQVERAAGTGSAYDGEALTVVSGADGLVQVQLPVGATAGVRTYSGVWRRFVVPDAASYELPSLVV